MKKNLFGLLALVVAIGAVAFTTAPNAKRLTYFFAYNGPAAMTQAQVESPANWIQVSDIGPLVCNAQLIKACRIEVPDTYTKVSGSVRVLQVPGDANPADIDATNAANPATTFYVSGGTSVTAIRNKS